MVQINLPKNSEVEKGIFYKDKTGSKNIRKVNVYRWDPSSGENPRHGDRDRKNAAQGGKT